jgi:PKD repeat protein
MKTLNKIFLGLVCFMQFGLGNLKASTPPMLLRLEAEGQSMQNETVVYFDSSGTFNYNDQYDAPSLGVSPGYLNIITRFDSIDFQVKCLPLLTQNISIPIKVVTGTSGSYQIYANDIQNLPSGACIMLHDNLTNSDYDLRLGSYTCNISDTESVARFVLNISISLLSVSGNSLNPTCSASGNGYIIASGVTGTAPWNYYWKDSSNNLIKTSLLKTTSDTLFGLNKGAYSVDINTNGTCSNGTLTFYLKSTLSPIASYTVSADTISISDTEGARFTNKSTNAGGFWWDFGDGGGINDTNATYYYASPGTYTVTLTAFGSVCADTSVYFKEITIVDADVATSIKTITKVTNNIIIDRDANDYYVKFNYSAKVNAVISVSDLLGGKINADIEVKEVTNEKIYINTSNNKNQLLIISATSTVGEKVYRKIIN